MPGPAFNANMAVLYGRFVQAAYTMYGNNPNNPTPLPSNDFPAGYQPTAWIQMQDFVLESLSPTFYGLLLAGFGGLQTWRNSSVPSVA
jgi:hypothetical protein